MLKRILVIIGSASLGLLFIASAWFKLFPIEPFEYQITGSTFFGWDASVVVARLVIALEFFLGVSLLMAYNLKKTSLYTVALLGVFCLHLIYLFISRGNEVDCGCMGSAMAFTPLQGLLKNLVMIVVALLLYKFGFDFKFKVRYFQAYVLVACISVVFIVNPVDLKYADTYLNKPFDHFDLNLDPIYNSVEADKVQQPMEDIRNKKLIIAFLSASCPHCKIAASKIAVIKRKNPSLPFYFFINGDDADIELFLKKTENTAIPHSKLNGKYFVEAAGLSLPVIYYYNRGRVEKQVDYYTLDQAHIEQWLKSR